MCGIAGIVNLRGQPLDHETLKRMTDAVSHRGPDGEGVWLAGPIGLGHRRLAIIDLSPAGRQPMLVADGSLAITYNGEVYNFRELRAELLALGHAFHSRTDSEVVLHAYQQWGEACLDRLNGMYAFAIWDARRHRLLLARDRYGIKPVYYWLGDRRFAFASEIKAILTLADAPRGVCPEALHEYFTFQNVFSDRTLFRDIRLLPPGHTATLETESETFRLRRYWDFDFQQGDESADGSRCADDLFECFSSAVERQLVSDVPIGSYLSGGMDSGSITAVATQHLGRIHTFTGGFDFSSASGLELGFDERSESEMMANTFKTEHYEVVLHAGDMEQVMRDLIWHLEDLRLGQCYPNFYVARLASKFVKVVLSGAGGDELFGGYPWRYFQAPAATDADDYLRQYYAFWQRLVPDSEKLALFNADTRRSIGDHSTFEEFRAVFRGADPRPLSPEQCVRNSLYFEAKTFLHGLLLVEDKLSMAHSLETRVPFLDNELVEFSQRVPAGLKLASFGAAPRVDEDDVGKRHRFVPSSDGKAVFREAMRRLIPSAILERRKQGFSGPYETWYRGESLDYIRRMLNRNDALIYNYLEPAYVERILEEHTCAKANHRLLIWSFLCFEWWHRLFLPPVAP